jgi:hypothetical protein
MFSAGAVMPLNSRFTLDCALSNLDADVRGEGTPIVRSMSFYAVKPISCEHALQFVQLSCASTCGFVMWSVNDSRLLNQRRTMLADFLVLASVLILLACASFLPMRILLPDRRQHSAELIDTASPRVRRAEAGSPFPLEIAVRMQAVEPVLCAICLSEAPGRNMIQLSPCHHIFHDECILEWCSASQRCPLCRRIVRRGQLLRAASPEQEQQPQDVSGDRHVMGALSDSSWHASFPFEREDEGTDAGICSGVVHPQGSADEEPLLV